MAEYIDKTNEFNISVEVRVFGKQRFTIEEMRVEAESVWQTQPSCQVFRMGFDSFRDDNDDVVFVQHARNFESSATADFLVLKEIRKLLADGRGRGDEWCAFLSSLSKLYRSRCKDGHDPMEIALHCDLHEVGDYARAALEALRTK